MFERATLFTSMDRLVLVVGVRRAVDVASRDDLRHIDDQRIQVEMRKNPVSSWPWTKCISF